MENFTNIVFANRHIWQYYGSLSYFPYEMFSLCFCPRMQNAFSSMEHLKYLVRAAAWTMTLFTILMTRVHVTSLNKTIVNMIHVQSEYYNVMGYSVVNKPSLILGR